MLHVGSIPSRLSSTCAWWGALIARRRDIASISVITGLLIALVLSAGASRAVLARSVSDQWVVRGSQLSADRTTFRKLFGGLPRELILVISPRLESTESSPRSALTRQAMRALQFATETLFSEKKLALSTNGASVNISTFCARPTVPNLFRPTGVRGYAVDRSLFSYGYAFLTRCMANTGTMPEGMRPLPEKWGIPQFPCRRASTLDCFGDGDLDYPEALKLIDANSLALFMRDSAAKNSSQYRNCTTALENIYLPLTSLAFPEDRQRQVSEARILTIAMNEFVVPTLATWGYGYRKRISDFDSEESLRNYISAAISNSRNKSITIGDCIDKSLPCCRLWNGLAVDPATFVGDTASGGVAGDRVISEADAIRTAVVTENENSNELVSSLDRSLPNSGADRLRRDVGVRLNLILDFEKAFIDLFKPMHLGLRGTGYALGEDFEDTKLHFFATRSSDDILRDGNRAPAGLIVGGYAVMILYTAFALFNFRRPFGFHNLVFSRVGLGMTAIMLLSAGTVAGFGLMSWFRTPLAPTTTNVLPFVALGIGLDDAFVLISAVAGSCSSARDILPASTDVAEQCQVGDRALPDGVKPGENSLHANAAVEQLTCTPAENLECNRSSSDQNNVVVDVDRECERRMRDSLRLAGPSIILTSFSLAVGFLVASAVRIPAVYTFNYQLAATVVINLLLTFLVFVPLCSADCRRVLRNGCDIVPCLKFGRRLKYSENQCQSGTFSGCLSHFAEQTLGPRILLRSRATSLCVIAISLLLTAAMLAISIAKTEAGLPLNTVALRGTYQRAFLDIQERTFPVYNAYLVHVVQEQNGRNRSGVMARKDVQQGMVQQADALQGAFRTSATPKISDISWFFNSSFSLLGLHNAQIGQKQLNTPIASEAEYRETFATFATTSGASFLNDIYCVRREDLVERTPCDLEGGYPGEIVRDVEVRGSRMQFLQSGLKETSTIVSAIKSSRAALRSAERSAFAAYGELVESFVYGYIYEFWEQYVQIYRNLGKVVGFALLGLSMVTLILLGSISMTLLILLVICCIIIQIFGICTLINVQLNAVSVTTYVIAVAMSVEFTAHFAHAYMSVHCSEDAQTVRSSNCDGSSERRQRALMAFATMLSPTTNGFLSTVISLLVLFSSKFPFVRLYYALSWCIVVFISYLNGIVTLPSLLALAGPLGRNRHQAQQDLNIDQNGSVHHLHRSPSNHEPVASQQNQT